MEEAKRKAFDEGRAQGLHESTNSREQSIAQTLKSIAAGLSTLFAAETERAKIYEQEALKLALCGLEKLFPLFLQKFGQAEMMAQLQAVLERQTNQKSIRVEVHPEDEEYIDKYLKSLNTPDEKIIHVVGASHLNMSSFRLSWTDGGAVRDAPALAEEILKTLEDLLAEGTTSLHDREEVIPNPSDQPQDETL
ncbi:MAG: hypothetical protein L6Q57_03935 [Alphaproteobacteria bacterium]|nr:hypothetical protein [Alphaproteobacteria bacterium]